MGSVREIKNLGRSGGLCLNDPQLYLTHTHSISPILTFSHIPIFLPLSIFFSPHSHIPIFLPLSIFFSPHSLFLISPYPHIPTPVYLFFSTLTYAHQVLLKGILHPTYTSQTYTYTYTYTSQALFTFTYTSQSILVEQLLNYSTIPYPLSLIPYPSPITTSR